MIICRDGSRLATITELASAEADEFDGHTPTSAGNTDFAGTRKLLLESWEVTLGNRFADLEAGVMQACCIADFAGWPADDKDRGRASIHTLMHIIIKNHN